MLPFLFTTLKRRLGTEDTKWWSVSGVILSHSSCKQVLRWATVWGQQYLYGVNSICMGSTVFALQNAPHILYWRQVGTAGRPVKYPYPLPPQPGLCNVCRMWFCIVLLKYAWTSLEKMSSWRQHIVLQNLYVLFSINGAITEVQVTFAKGTDTTPYHDRPWLDLVFGLLLWSGAHSIHSSQKIPEILIHLTTVHVSTVWWSIPDASEPREVDGASGHC